MAHRSHSFLKIADEGLGVFKSQESASERRGRMLVKCDKMSKQQPPRQIIPTAGLNASRSAGGLTFGAVGCRESVEPREEKRQRKWLD